MGRRIPQRIAERAEYGTGLTNAVDQIHDKRLVDGKSFHLADEVRYIQRRAARHDGRVVSIGQLVLFSTETGDAWLLDPSEQLAARSPLMATPSRSTSKKPILPLRSAGRVNIVSRGRFHLRRSGQRRVTTTLEFPDA